LAIRREDCSPQEQLIIVPHPDVLVLLTLFATDVSAARRRFQFIKPLEAYIVRVIRKSLQHSKFSRVRLGAMLGLPIAVLCAIWLSQAPLQPVQAVSAGIVISQVYGGAGCGTASCSTYKNDYIELFNRGASAVSVNGWSVQYAAAAGTTWQVTALTNTTIQPGQYFLVAESFGANGVNNLPTPDVTGTIAMSATAAKVALVNATTALSGSCPAGASIVDLVGYGATASCFETAVAPAPSTTTADVRGANGCTETDNNSTDFSVTTPNPRNTASTLNPCGGGGTTTCCHVDVSCGAAHFGIPELDNS